MEEQDFDRENRSRYEYSVILTSDQILEIVRFDKWPLEGLPKGRTIFQMHLEDALNVCKSIRRVAKMQKG